MLLAPEQAFFLRENLKLRLLNARLALLSRQFDTAQSDLRDAQVGARPLLRPQRASVAAAAPGSSCVQTRCRARRRRHGHACRGPDATLAALAAGRGAGPLRRPALA